MTRFDRQAAYWIGGVLMAAATLQAWTHRFYVHPDGLSYIDIAAAYVRGDWQEALNASWSPLQAWLYVPFIAADMPRTLEPAVFHLLNLPQVLFAYLAFWYLVRFAITDSYARAAALIIMAWTQIQLMPLWFLSGDRLASAFLFLAMGALIRSTESKETPARAALTGVAFGLAYLSKAVMLPVAVVTLPLLLVRRAFRSFGLAVLCLVAVVTPWIVTLSQAEGRFTYSAVGALSYAWDVNDIPRVFYQGDPARGDRMPHPPRILVESPRVYEFATPFDATYAVHYEPAYWYEGVHTERELPKHMRKILRNTWDAFVMIGFVLLGILVLWRIAAQRRISNVFWLIMWPAVAGVGSYLLLHVEPRYISPFVALAGAAALSPLSIPRNPRTYLIGAAAALLLLFGMVGRLGLDALSLVGYDRRWVPARQNPAVVQALREAGIGEGDWLAAVRREFYAHNARILGARVVAEIGHEGDYTFKQIAEADRGHVYERLRSIGVDAIIAQGIAAPGWQPLGNTGYSIRLLP